MRCTFEPPTTLTIDLASVRSNLQRIRASLPKAIRVMVMVKAESYGTSAEEMTRFYISQGIDIVGVSHVQEGIALRRHFPNLSIFVIHVPSYEAEEALANDLEFSVCDLETIDAVDKMAEKLGKKAKVHLDINTGMHRFGCREEEALLLARGLKAKAHIEAEALMTHFIAAEYKEFDPVTHAQMSRFEKKIQELENQGLTFKWRHAANSSAVLRHPNTLCNMVRVGFALFGITSSQEESSWNLAPALTLTTRIQGINHCQAGESVGYNAAYKVSGEKERVAILPIGYRDGIHLSYSGRGYALIHGKRAPFIGRICMDFMMVNISHIPEARVGDRVTFFDKKPPLTVEACAGFIETNPRELLVSLGARIKRRFLPCE